MILWKIFKEFKNIKAYNNQKYKKIQEQREKFLMKYILIIISYLKIKLEIL